MKKTKRQRGITLIALVITIIVLLILAGVSIQMLTGQNGILKRAGEASEKTGKANVIDQAKLDIIDKQTENEGNISKEELHDILKEYFTNVPEVEDEVWDNFPEGFPTLKATEEYGGYNGIEVGSIYKGTLSNTKTGEVISPKEVVSGLKGYIGAYVNYGVELDNNPSTPDWRIFYAQNAGGANRIYLIAADYVPTGNAALIDAMGGGTTKAMMKPSTSSGPDKLSVQWSNVPSDLQTITLENWKEIFKDGSYELKSYDNSKCVARLRETTNWVEFAKGTGGEYAIGGPTVQMWCAAWNTIIPSTGKVEESDTYKQITADVTDTYGYKYTIESWTGNNSCVNGTGDLTDRSTLEKGDTYSLFFPHTEFSGITANNVTGNSFGYWLSSPSANSDYSIMCVDYKGCLRCDTNGLNCYGVRPVVCLTSGIHLTDSGKVQKGKPVYDIVQ